VFNRQVRLIPGAVHFLTDGFYCQLISELSDTVATCLLDVTDLSNGLNVEKPAVNDLILSNQILAERGSHTGTFQDLENNLRNAVANTDEATIRDLVRYSDVLSSQPGGAINVTRILWKTIIDAPRDLADLILSSTAKPFDFNFIDDINGRTTLHSAAMVGMLRLVNICLEKGVEPSKCDAYGRSALHYACMNGHRDVCCRLLEVGLLPDQVDMDNYSPLTYATLRGSADCIRALLEQGQLKLRVNLLGGDSMPLALASQAGHLDVVNLLLEHGARSLPNSNGEYPIHLAAKAGHTELCQILIGQPGWDLADKYNEWTPLFHAARYGHQRCVQVLLDAGARVDALDELGNAAVYYAAWFGHRACVETLLHSLALLPNRRGLSPHQKSPPPEGNKPFESDIDMIPLLSLPPPIMPYRIYGHSFLDNTFLVQISLGQNMWDASRFIYGTGPVKLHPRLTGAQNRDLTLHASPFLKLVVTARGDATTAPFSISLPMKDEAHVFTFQVHSLEKLTLEFSIYPNFGTKTIGRATALPALLQGAKPDTPHVLPILDHRLHVLGEASQATRSRAHLIYFDRLSLELMWCRRSGVQLSELAAA
jgi:CDK inhibitor PHO81